MIRIFKNMRRILASDKEFVKYSRYAIGEILLVVIGILIALQVNNWNENRKLQKKEIQMIAELLTWLEPFFLSALSFELRAPFSEQGAQLVNSWLSENPAI